MWTNGTNQQVEQTEWSKIMIITINTDIFYCWKLCNEYEHSNKRNINREGDQLRLQTQVETIYQRPRFMDDKLFKSSVEDTKTKHGSNGYVDINDGSII